MNKPLAAITALALCAVASTTAHADDAVVPPLLTRGMDPLQTLNMTSLVASELDFLGKFDGVSQLDAAPSGFGGKCLTTASCLGGIANKNKASAVLAGAATNKGGTVDIMLVYFDNGRIVRSKEFSVENTPSVLADSMSGFIRELVTGESIQQVQNRDTVAFSDENSFDEEDDLFADEDLFAGIPPVAAATVNRTIPTDSGYDEPSELDDLELDLIGEDLSDGPVARAPEPEPEPVIDYEPVLSDPDPVRAEEEFTFEFASSADSVTDAESSAGVVDASYTEPSRASSGYVDEYSEPSSSRSSNSSSSRSEQSSSSRYDDYDDYDEPRSVGRNNTRSNSGRSSSSRSNNYDDDRATTRPEVGPAKATITARIGRSTFQTLDFVTYGAEVSLSATDNLRFVAGIEPHSTKRTIPPALLEEGQASTIWNTIIPVNAGLQYSFGQSMWRPYAGGDVLVIPGYVSETEGVTLEGGSTATGARIRGGLDVVLSETFALNLNISYGRWNGKDFDAVQRDLEDTGIVPQISAGTVVRF